MVTLSCCRRLLLSSTLIPLFYKVGKSDWFLCMFQTGSGFESPSPSVKFHPPLPPFSSCGSPLMVGWTKWGHIKLHIQDVDGRRCGRHCERSLEWCPFLLEDCNIHHLYDLRSTRANNYTLETDLDSGSHVMNISDDTATIGPVCHDQIGRQIF